MRLLCFQDHILFNRRKLYSREHIKPNISFDMIKKTLISLFLFIPVIAMSQVKITDDTNNTPHPNAVLQIVSNKNKGVMLPAVKEMKSLPYYGETPDINNDGYGDDASFAGSIIFVEEKKNFYYYDGKKWIFYPQASASAMSDIPVARFAMKAGNDDSFIRGKGPIWPAGFPDPKWLRFTAQENDDPLYSPIIHDSNIVLPNATYEEFEIQKDGMYVVSTKMHGHDFVGNISNKLANISIYINYKNDNSSKPFLTEKYEQQEARILDGDFFNEIAKLLGLSNAVERDCIAFLRSSITLKKGDKIKVRISPIDGDRWASSISIPFFWTYYFDITAASMLDKKQISELMFIYYGE